MRILTTLLTLLSFLSFARAQLGILGGTPLFTNSTCLTGPNTTFTNCNTYYSTLTNCTSNTTTEVQVGCECTQGFFNLIVDCKSELRVCSGNNTWDATIDPLIASWHSLCDFAGVKPTTPVLSSTSGGAGATQTVASGSVTAAATSGSGSTITTTGSRTATKIGGASGSATTGGGTSGTSSSAVSTASSSAGNRLLGIREWFGVVPIVLLVMAL